MKRDKALEFLRQLGVNHVGIRSDVDWNFYPEFHPRISVCGNNIELSPITTGGF